MSSRPIGPIIIYFCCELDVRVIIKNRKGAGGYAQISDCYAHIKWLNGALEHHCAHTG